MPVHRKRFRIEEVLMGDMPVPSAGDGDIGPMHSEIMAELRAIRAQMAGPRRGVGEGWAQIVTTAGCRCASVA